MRIPNVFRRPVAPPRVIATPPNTRIFAIGDVHGRPDLLTELLDRIDADLASRPVSRSFVIFLGDLIDRGPDSRGVIELLLARRQRIANAVFVMGNHEEMLLSVLGPRPDQIWRWLEYGGAECLQSYGLDSDELYSGTTTAAVERVRAAIPRCHLAFIDGFADSFVCGDYLFVHAGIRPGISLKRQSTADLRWIREDFLESTAMHPWLVVHGHSISEQIDEQPNRIGIDTGGYATGRLTALCAEEASRRYLSTGGPSLAD